MKISNTLIGLLIIILGIFFLLTNFDLMNIDFNFLWPLFIIMLGLYFELSYFQTRENPRVLVPGGMLITMGLLFYINIVFGWHLMRYLWPIFPFSVSVGLFQLYFFGPREREVLISSTIIGGFSIISLFLTFFSIDFDIFIPIVLIMIGFIIMFKKNTK